MRATNMKKAILRTQLLLVTLAMLLASTAHAAAPGITGTSFLLTAKPSFISQPDGNLIYSWGYGCTITGSRPQFAPRTGFGPATAPLANANCPDMQVPGPTLIVTAGTNFTVVLTNGLPNAAGNTSILFPGFQVAATGGAQGLLAREAVQGNPVTYTVTVPATAAGTHAYYSGTQGDLQVEMGLYGAVIVVPAGPPTPACPTRNRAAGVDAGTLSALGEEDYRLATAAYNNSQACYDREYLFQFSEIDPRIHRQAEEQVLARQGCAVGTMGCSLNVATEPYVPAYFLVNGRSMPDLMDSNYAPEYPHQPYNGNPHMHPGDQTLVRVIGQGRWQHPFHEHGNHVRILGRDGNLITSATNASLLAGPLLFTTSTTPGQAVDGIFYWTGKGLNWDAYGHHGAPNATTSFTCTADANGYYTSNPIAINYYEWCQDHNKPLEKAPFGNVATGGPATLPDATILANGAWYGGSPYLGPEATQRAVGFTGSTPPSGTIANSPTEEAGFAYMWHSHNEREITTNNIFPGGMMMMMLVDSREFPIDESN
jgi:FtsP/CotA-like multicopper oxidase with cupredoxin domain